MDVIDSTVTQKKAVVLRHGTTLETAVSRHSLFLGGSENK